MSSVAIRGRKPKYESISIAELNSIIELHSCWSNVWTALEYNDRGNTTKLKKYLDENEIDYKHLTYYNKKVFKHLKISIPLLKKYVTESESWIELIDKKIGGGHNKKSRGTVEDLKLYLDKHNINYEHLWSIKLWEKFTIEKLKILVANSNDFRGENGLLKKIGYENYKVGRFKKGESIGCKTITSIKNYLDENEICYEHFRTSKQNYYLDVLYGKIKTPNGMKSSREYGFVKFIIDEKILENKCQKCGLEPFWNGKKLVLELDHWNGNHSLNILWNLRFLCPNCHTQTLTHHCKKEKLHIKVSIMIQAAYRGYLVRKNNK